MKIRSVTCIWISSLLWTAAWGDQVMLTTEETLLDFKLQHLQWKNSLSDTEKQIAISALASKKAPIVQSAINALAIHKVEDGVPALAKGVGVSDTDLNLFAKVTADAIASNGSLMAQMEGAGFLDEISTPHKEKLREHVTQVEVINETKSLRSGKSSTRAFEKQTLKRYQKQLLQYAQNKETASINIIIDTLSKAEIAGAEQYDLVNVLRTYDPNSVQAVIQAFSDEEQIHNMTVYGKVLLLSFLDISSYTVPDEVRAQIKIVFERFVDDEPNVNRSAFWALEHIKQIDAIDKPQNINGQ